MHAHRYAPSAATITFIAPTGSDSWRNICCACWAYVHIVARPVTSAFSGGVEGRKQACALLRIVLRAKDPASSKTRFLKKKDEGVALPRNHPAERQPSRSNAPRTFLHAGPASQCAVSDGCQTSGGSRPRVIHDRRIPLAREWESGNYREPRQPLPGPNAGPL